MNRTSTLAGSLISTDLFAIEIWRDELVLVYPGFEDPLVGKGVHRLAPLLALNEPVPSSTGVIAAGFFPRGQAPQVAGNKSQLGKRVLARPVCLPSQTEWVLFDSMLGKDPKWLVRLCDYRRITLSPKGRVCVVFNDHVFAITPHNGTTPQDLFDDVVAKFPQRRDVIAQPGEITTFSTWPANGVFLQPFPAFRVKFIERLKSEEKLSALTVVFGDPSPLTPRRPAAATKPGVPLDL